MTHFKKPIIKVMTNDLIKTNGTKIDFTADQIDLIRKVIAPKANDNELKLFLYQCKRTGLDPMSRQIYCIPIGGKMTIQTSIDGFRVIAERSGNYAGQGEPEFIEDEKGNIKCCKVRVFKFSDKGERYEASVGVAYWAEYALNSPMWSKMKHTMISKCAEALALRKAFPQDLSGLYTTDEMQQAAPITEDVEINDVPTQGERQDLINLVYSSTLEDDKKEETIEWINTKCNTYKQYETMQAKLEMVQQEIGTMTNPSQKDINKHLKKTIG